MWTAVFLAQDEVSAAELKEMFLTNGIIVKIKPIINKQNNIKSYEFYVPSAELNYALELIIDFQE